MCLRWTARHTAKHWGCIVVEQCRQQQHRWGLYYLPAKQIPHYLGVCLAGDRIPIDSLVRVVITPKRG